MSAPMDSLQVGMNDVRREAWLCFLRLHSIPHTGRTIIGTKINEIDYDYGQVP